MANFIFINNNGQQIIFTKNDGNLLNITTTQYVTEQSIVATAWGSFLIKKPKRVNVSSKIGTQTTVSVNSGKLTHIYKKY